MCGSKPKPPTPTRDQLAAEAEAKQIREAELQRQRDEKSEMKKRRTELGIQALGMRYGRSSLLTGGRGGQGYAAPMVRSLLESN